MKSNSISNDRILDIVYDLADICGMRIDAFIEHLQEEYGDPEFSTEGLPEEVVAELENAKQLRKESREAKRKSAQDSALQEEITAFCAAFPEVRAEEIPESVWEEVASGVDLQHAYALYLLTQKTSGGRAEEVNRDTAARSAAALSEGSTEPAFTREQVEKMSAKDVAKNYKGILRSFGNWKF